MRRSASSSTDAATARRSVESAAARRIASSSVPTPSAMPIATASFAPYTFAFQLERIVSTETFRPFATAPTNMP